MRQIISCSYIGQTMHAQTPGIFVLALDQMDPEDNLTQNVGTIFHNSAETLFFCIGFLANKKGCVHLAATLSLCWVSLGEV